MKIVSIVGARPQFIKEAIVGAALRQEGIDEILVNTGQHYDENMAEVFFEGLSIKSPDYNLGIGSGTHAFQTASAMVSLEELLLKEKPQYVLVYGDTNATLAGALVGAKMKIPVIHVEAGLRQHPKDMPEEINRVVTDHVSSLLFCPTMKAVENLSAEGVKAGVHFVGDVMLDLFLKMKGNLDLPTRLRKFELQEKGFIMATVHRDFNTDNPDRLKAILSALEEISQITRIVLPLHPRAKKFIKAFGYESLLHRIQVVDPLPYHDMMALLVGCKKIITDSGGLQKEAYFAGVPALVLMQDTAWIELVDTGWNILVDVNKEKIISGVLAHEPLNGIENENLYGEGYAGEKIAHIIVSKS
jgi:UDP-N-acetylglucosamine 2-epimerase (non-hydrolysing)